MKVKEFLEWMQNLSEDFNDYEVVASEERTIDKELSYRLDKPIKSVFIDEKNTEMVFLTDKKSNDYQENYKIDLK